MNTYLNLILYQKITDGVDVVNDQEARFPFHHLGVDKNGMRIHGGVMIPGFQAYECADGLWVQLLELDLLEPLERIQGALDKSSMSMVKRTAISDCIFCRGPMMVRVLNYLTAYSSSFARSFKENSRCRAMQFLDSRSVRHIPVGNLRDVHRHPQVMYLGLLQDGTVLSPIILHGNQPGGSMAPDSRGHNARAFQTTRMALAGA